MKFSLVLIGLLAGPAFAEKNPVEPLSNGLSLA
jgi:hypothetical protein